MVPQKVYEWWTQFYVLLLRPMLKWVLRYVTGKCELLRITYEETDRAIRTKRIEKSLNFSHNDELRSYGSSVDFPVEDAAKKIAELKFVIPEVHATFQPSLEDSLYRIRSYNKILHDAEELRKIKYDSEDDDHEAKLRNLWALYYPEKALPARVGNHWQDMGFQGTDPKTDFRGMGMLGLQQMIYFAQTYPDAARHTFSQSHHPQYGYSFAIVAINITGLGHNLLAKRKLRSHFYSLENRNPSLTDFHQVFCHLLYGFSQYWIDEKPKDIMEFSRVRDRYIKLVKKKLKSDNPVLLSSFQEK